MQIKMKITGIDLLMTVLLLLLMAYQITGQQGKAADHYMDFTGDGSPVCCVGVVSLWQKGYSLVYVP